MGPLVLLAEAGRTTVLKSLFGLTPFMSLMKLNLSGPDALGMVT